MISSNPAHPTAASTHVGGNFVSNWTATAPISNDSAAAGRKRKAKRGAWGEAVRTPASWRARGTPPVLSPCGASVPVIFIPLFCPSWTPRSQLLARSLRFLDLLQHALAQLDHAIHATRKLVVVLRHHTRWAAHIFNIT